MNDFRVMIDPYIVYTSLLCFTVFLQWHYIIRVTNEMASILGIRVFVPKPVSIYIITNIVRLAA